MRLAMVAIVAASVGVGFLLASSAAYANVATAVTSPPPVVSVTQNADGSVAVTVDGGWTWPTLKSPSATHPCDSRYGVGWAMAWNDPDDPGTTLTYVSGKTLVRVHVGSKGVDPANTDDHVSYDHADPCGTFT